MLYLTTALSHITYYFVWRFPSNFIKFSKYLNCNPFNLLYRLNYYNIEISFNWVKGHCKKNKENELCDILAKNQCLLS